MDYVECYRCGHLVPENRPHIVRGEKGEEKCYPNWGRFCNSGQSILLSSDTYNDRDKQKRAYCRAAPYHGWNPVGYCETHLALYLQMSGRNMNHIRGLPPSPIVPLRKCALGCRGGCALAGARAPKQNPYTPNRKACWLMVGREYTQRWELEFAGEVAELRKLNGVQEPSDRPVKPPSDLANFETKTRRSS